jgi:hypothetical protein
VGGCGARGGECVRSGSGSGGVGSGCGGVVSSGGPVGFVLSDFLRFVLADACFSAVVVVVGCSVVCRRECARSGSDCGSGSGSGDEMLCGVVVWLVL